MTTPAELLTASNSYLTREEIRRRVADRMGDGYPEFRYCLNNADTWVVCGAGPSIADHVATIQRLKKQGANVVSVNKSHDWLLERGIVPWGHVLLDGHEWVSDYVKRPRKDVCYFLASQCHPKTFDALRGSPVFLWHAGQGFEDGAEPDRMFREQGFGRQPIIGGGTTVGQRVPILGVALGARKFHMFGMDSSRTAGRLHAMPKPHIVDPGKRRLAYIWNGTRYIFDTNTHMARQQLDFDAFIADLPTRWANGQVPRDFAMIFHGSGLTPFWAATLGLHADPACNADPERVGGWIEKSPHVGQYNIPAPTGMTIETSAMLGLTSVEMGVEHIG